MSDDPTEHVQEEIHHHATHGDGHGHGPSWITGAALTAAFLAAFAAVSSSLATSHLTASTLKRIEANDQWNYYQAKSIKTSIIDSRNMAYNALEPGKVPDAVQKQHKDDISKKAEYNKKAEEDDPVTPQGLAGIKNKADGLQGVSMEHLQTHETYEMSATMFHIAIAIVAIAVVAKRKEFWYISMIGGFVGLYFFGTAFAHAPLEKEEKHETAQVTPASLPIPTAGEHASKTPESPGTQAHEERPTTAP